MAVTLMIDPSDVRNVAGFQNLSGASSPFSLPTGFYFIDFDAADPNAGTTLQVADGAGNVLANAAQNGVFNQNTNVPGFPGGVWFQVGPSSGSLTVTVSNGTASNVIIRG